MKAVPTNMMYYLSVAAGGALGAVGRVWLMTAAERLLPARFPFGTLTVNILGSLLMGVCFVVFMERGALDDAWRPVLVAGFLAAFTTFSTFSLDALRLLENGLFWQAAAYVPGTVLLCLLAVWTGMTLTRIL